MRFSFHAAVSQLTLLCLTLLGPIPRAVTSYPVFPTFPLPTVDGPQLESALVHLQAALQADTLATWPRDLRPDLLEPGDEWDGSWEEDEEEALLRTQRGDAMDRLLSPFAGGLSLESVHYQETGEGEEGGKRNEALTSIAGGLQAVSREKGGFGFRFGRKRWTDRGSGTDEGGLSTGGKVEFDRRRRGRCCEQMIQ